MFAMIRITAALFTLCISVQVATAVANDNSSVNGPLGNEAKPLLQAIKLHRHCPPSFSLVDGVCKFFTLYQLYPGSRGDGVLRVQLPPIDS